MRGMLFAFGLVCVVLLTTISCEQPAGDFGTGGQFNLEIVNHAARTLHVGLVLENRCLPRPLPDGSVPVTSNRIQGWSDTVNAGATVSYSMRSTVGGDGGEKPNGLFGALIQSIQFLDGAGAPLPNQSYQVNKTEAIIPQGQPNAGQHVWSVPSAGRPFHFELVDTRLVRLHLTEGQ